MSPPNRILQQHTPQTSRVTPRVESTNTTIRYYTSTNKSCLESLRSRLKRHWHSLRTPMLEEGLDFDDVEDSLFANRNKNYTPNRVTVLKWLIGALIAIALSCVAVTTEYCIDQLTSIKFSLVNNMLVTYQELPEQSDIVLTSSVKVLHNEAPTPSEGYLSSPTHVPQHQRPGIYQLMPGLGVYIGINLSFVVIASLLVSYVDVKAKGSGVPEIKSYLNGRKIHRVLALRTFVSKVIGVVLSVSGSLVVGKEGPMMHAGAVIGSLISQYRGGAYLENLGFIYFRNDKEKRAFVSLGCACGVAAAFSAPLGAVLFVIEEAATYWSVSLTWLTFFACILSTLVVDVSLSGMRENAQWGVLSQSAVVSFGSFEGASRDPCYAPQPAYQIQELPIFIAIGVLGGLAGALFILVNEQITKWRMRVVGHIPGRRFAEAISVCLFTSTLFAASVVLLPCRDSSTAEYTFDLPQGNHSDICPDLSPKGNTCGDWDSFSDMETLALSSLDKSVRQLFHSPLLFRTRALLVYAASTWVLACVSYGISVPSGLFVPAIAIGSAFGRWAGQVLWQYHPAVLGRVDPGTYALIGAAAMLGGVTRMTISIVVILLETTNNSTYAVPIMLTILTAKLVGDLLTQGIYDVHIRLQGILFLHDDLEPSRLSAHAGQVMVREPHVLGLVVSVKDLVAKLHACTHNGFPVVSNVTHVPEGLMWSEDPELGRYRQRVSRNTEDHHSHAPGTRNTGEPLGRARTVPAGGSRAVQRTSPRSRVRSVSCTMQQDGRQSNVKFVPAGLFEGTILRSTLLVLLFERQFVRKVDVSQDPPSHTKLVGIERFYKYYPRSPSLDDINSRLHPGDWEKYVDLRPYVNRAALSVHYSVPIRRVHQLFRALGLRHLTVVDSTNTVVGIITREQIAGHHAMGADTGEASAEEEHEPSSELPSSPMDTDAMTDGGASGVYSIFERDPFPQVVESPLIDWMVEYDLSDPESS